ncbi:MAG TPA: hypothetical protein VFB43_01395 [Terracidiphilus sp.]|jgi:hypothetical protein|nr:hypothetical protein [Terracidiphilus sp.]
MSTQLLESLNSTFLDVKIGSYNKTGVDISRRQNVQVDATDNEVPRTGFCSWGEAGSGDPVQNSMALGSPVFAPVARRPRQQAAL